MAYARIAGLLYLLIAISGGFSIGYVPSIIVAPDNALVTAQNLVENMNLFRLGIAADIAVFLMEIILTVMLFRMFRTVSKTLSWVAAYSRMGMALIMGVNLLNHLIPIYLISGSGDYLSAFQPAQLQSLALVFFQAHQAGILIWGLFFALHLVALGYMVFKSGYVPKILGLLMGLGSLGYLLESLIEFTMPEMPIVPMLATGLLVIAVLGELSFTFWLLIKGVKVPEEPKAKLNV